MRIRVLLASAAMTAIAAPAMAADLGNYEPAPVPEYTAPVAAPAPTWSGFYLGALFGYTWANTDGESILEEDDEFEANGIDGGAYAGANWQFGSFVVGAEADILASGVDSDDDDGYGFEQGLNGSLRARAGVALDQFLLYGTAGVAASKFEVESPVDDDDQTAVGWTAGVGGEALLTQNITARVEYRYTDYGEETFELDGGDYDTDINTHSVRAGVGFKF